MMINEFHHDLQANSIAFAKEYNNVSLTILPGYPGAAAAQYLARKERYTLCIRVEAPHHFPRWALIHTGPTLTKY
jgi:hypothetical protein